ncbi:MAG: hypothetical protein HYR66_17820 [Sphingobacteriales bacterium]|nr:hypothetical protein [Sphingobacteriales bacterium]MBI3720082.1 hypothetical protein [Sphingobacteriales bacterium]
MSKEAMTTGNEQPANDETISSAKTIADAEQPQTINYKPQTEEMEVHHHTHGHGKKNWKTYVWEFLMLFLAVFCGFLAEYQLEHKIEHERERQYMKSLITDIKEDIRFIGEQQPIYINKQSLLDSLIDRLNSPSASVNTNDLYYYARLASKNDIFPANTRTIDQMKFAGGFRLIKNEEVADGIMSYYSELPQIQSLEVTEQSETNEYRKIAVQIFSAVVFNEINSTNEVTRPVNNPALRINDKKLWGDLSGWVHYIKNTRIGLSEYKKRLHEKGQKLIQLIEKEYHLE